MAILSSTERRRSVTVPFLTLAVAIAVVAGLVIGAQSVRLATNAGALVAAPVPTGTINDANRPDRARDVGNPSTLPLAAPAVTSGACASLEARDESPYCGVTTSTRVTAPLATWLACEFMDPTTFRQLCHQGDGGRWVQGARVAGQ